MSARDLYHDVVVQALKADGWIITDDPLTISYGIRDLYIDLGAIIAAEKDQQKIAVEINSFLGRSPVQDLEESIGKFNISRTILREIVSGHTLYLTIPKWAYEAILSEKLGLLVINTLQIRLIIFDDQDARIVRWID